MLRKTALHADHLSLNAKMGEFAGYDMPLYYDLGVKKEHEWVRSSAGLFDVSHMGEVDFTGPGARDAIQKLITNDVDRIEDGRALIPVRRPRRARAPSHPRRPTS